MARRVGSLSLLGGVLGRSQIDPVGKVITLLQSLRDQCAKDAQTEADQFAKFSEFCVEKTGTKSESINMLTDTTTMLSAEINAKTAQKKEKSDMLAKTKSLKEKAVAKLDETETRCTKEQQHYLAENEDTVTALEALTNAIQSLEESKPGAGAKLMAVKVAVQRNPLLDEAMKALDHGVKWSSLLQVDPSDPEFKFHSGSILDLLKELDAQFTAKKKDRDADWDETKKSCNELKKSLTTKIEDATSQIESLEVAIGELEIRLADAKGEFVEADNQLKDDKHYLRDLTERCDKRARDNNQRSQARADEIAAIEKALDVLRSKVKEATEVNIRAFVQKKYASPSVHMHTALAFAQINEKVTHTRFVEQQENQKEDAMKLLTRAGHRLQSATLLSLVSRAGSDPFKKVKGLIEKLIDRLIKEATAETKKKGFCDEAMGKATKSRDFRHGDSNRLSAQIGELEVKKRDIIARSIQLKANIDDLQATLKEMTEMRHDESMENAETLKIARDGLAAVTDAISILQAYYKSAAKNDKYHSGELEKAALLDVSPVDVDARNPGAAKGAYKGQQGSSKGIIGLLEVIQTDFKHTISTVSAEEKQAHADFVEAERLNKVSTKKKETKIKLDTEDLAETKAGLDSKYSDLATATGLLDDALKELAKLNPVCVDSGMSYADRRKQREDEICALKWAREMLRPPEKQTGTVTGCPRALP